MKYPEFCTSVVDVTKAPYFADNTGKTDCTAALRLAIDDCLRGYIDGIEEVRRKLVALHEKYGGNVYVGAEAGKYIDGEIFVTGPEEPPLVRSLYFPQGTYLVSDTLCYSFENLCSRQAKDYTCELCRFIQIFGESRENTVIRLADHAEGFEAGEKKPVLSFNRSAKEDTETTNCAQMNTLEDITIDCGRENPGAIGVLYAASNCGRIENVDIRCESGLYGIDFDYSSEACIRSLKISGFSYGMHTGHTSPLVMDCIDLSQNNIAGILTKNGNIICREVTSGSIPLFSFLPGENGRYYCGGFRPTHIGDPAGAAVYTEENTLLQNKLPPKNEMPADISAWAFVDDYGAVADGITDSSAAIQKAMNSGKPFILFGTGKYRIERTVKIPATVKTVDFRYTYLVPGFSLVIGEMEGMFDVCEDSPCPFFARHLAAAGEGFFRVFKHSAKRTAVFRDISVFTALYFNTMPGSEVYFDNCFTLTAHYSQDAGLHRDGYVPVFCRMIPVEAHGQKVYCKNLNIERADIELLNDNSEVVIDGYKTEGPGILVKAVNGGKTQLNLFNAAWWGNKLPENAIFECRDSDLQVTGGNVFCYPDDDDFCLAFLIHKAGGEERHYLRRCSTKLSGKDALNRSWGRLLTARFQA